MKLLPQRPIQKSEVDKLIDSIIKDVSIYTEKNNKKAEKQVGAINPLMIKLSGDKLDAAKILKY